MEVMHPLADSASTRIRKDRRQAPARKPEQEVILISSRTRHIRTGSTPHERPSETVHMGVPMDLEFYEPAEAAALMRCTEAWLREGAASGKFPHVCWGKGKIIFTSEQIAEIARL